MEQSAQLIDEYPNDQTTGKLSRTISDFLVAIFWTICSYLFLTVIILGVLPSLFLGNYDLGTLLTYTVGIPITLWPALLIALPTVLLLMPFVSLFKFISRIMLLLLPILSVLVSILVLLVITQPCEGLGCIGHGFAIWAEVSMLIIAVSILPVSHIRSTIKKDRRISLKETLRLGLLLLLVFSLLGVVSVSAPLIIQGQEGKEKTIERRGKEQEIKQKLSNLKRYDLLRPTYKPKDKLTTFVSDESLNIHEGYRLRYGCNPDGSLIIDQYPLAKPIDIKSEEKEKYTEFKESTVTVSGKNAIVLEKYYTDSYYTIFTGAIPSSKPVATYLIWETKDLQMIIASKQCSLTIQNLVRISESMEPITERNLFEKLFDRY